MRGRKFSPLLDIYIHAVQRFVRSFASSSLIDDDSIKINIVHIMHLSISLQKEKRKAEDESNALNIYAIICRKEHVINLFNGLHSLKLRENDPQLNSFFFFRFWFLNFSLTHKKKFEEKREAKWFSLNLSKLPSDTQERRKTREKFDVLTVKLSGKVN